MWAKIKEAAISLLGQQRITFTETTNSLVGEAECDSGLSDPAMMDFLEVIHDNIPKGCVFSLYNRKPQIVFIAGTSREVVSEVEVELGLGVAA